MGRSLIFKCVVVIVASQMKELFICKSIHKYSKNDRQNVKLNTKYKLFSIWDILLNLVEINMTLMAVCIWHDDDSHNVIDVRKDRFIP